MNKASGCQSKRFPVDSFISAKYLNKVLVSAEDEAKAMGDEYVSVEHLFLSMLRNPSPSMKKIFKEFGITRERFLQAFYSQRQSESCQRQPGGNL